MKPPVHLNLLKFHAPALIAFVEKIESSIPLLNIYFLELQALGVSPQSYNPEDAELPVIVPSNEANNLYFNGQLTDYLPKGDIPGFNALVINENSRVKVNKENSRSTCGTKYSFIAPEYDGTLEISRSADVSPSLVGNKAIEAFKYFYKDDSSIYSTALQRDYIYYGITPSVHKGALNQNVSEYLSFIEVNPNTYFRISDQKTGSITDDPYIKETYASKKKKDFTEQELIDALWTKGVYNIRVEIEKSTSGTPQVLYIPVRPEEIWNFNYDRTYRHSTKFKHSRYSYTINPSKFTVKRYELEPRQLSLGRWNLAEESLYRNITFYEEDESDEITTTHSIDVTKMKSSKFEGNVKLNLGLDEIGDNNISTSVSSSTTTKETRTITINRKEKSDYLGHIEVYFYEPIIELKKPEGEYQMKTYSTGSITFGIAAY